MYRNLFRVWSDNETYTNPTGITRTLGMGAVLTPLIISIFFLRSHHVFFSK